MSPRDRARRWVAWLAHAPGLWLLDRQPFPPGLLVINALAIAATLAAMAGAVVLTERAWAAVPVWLVGHVAWGAYLVRRVVDDGPRDGRDSGAV